MQTKMRIKEKTIILDSNEDFEFMNLIRHISKIGHGNVTIKVRDAKPYRIIKTEESVFLTRDALKDTDSNSG